MVVSLQSFYILIPIMVIGAFAPGPEILFLLSQTRRASPMPGLMCAFGVAAGLAVHGVAMTLGVGGLVEAHPSFMDALRVLAGSYLLYLAYGFVKRPSGKQDKDRHEASSCEPSYRALFVKAMLNSIVSPKTLVFFLAIMPQFIDPARGGVQLQFAILCGTTVLVGLTCKSLLALGMHYFVRLFKETKPGLLRVQNWGFAGLFGLLALKLLIGFQ